MNIYEYNDNFIYFSFYKIFKNYKIFDIHFTFMYNVFIIKFKLLINYQ